MIELTIAGAACSLMLGWSKLSTGITRRRSGSEVEASDASAKAGALSSLGILVSSKVSKFPASFLTIFKYASILSFLAP